MPITYSTLPMSSDLIKHMLSFLEAKDLVNVNQVCKSLCELSNEEQLWKELYKKHHYIKDISEPIASYKTLFSKNYSTKKCYVWMNKLLDSSNEYDDSKLKEEIIKRLQDKSYRCVFDNKTAFLDETRNFANIRGVYIIFKLSAEELKKIMDDEKISNKDVIFAKGAYIYDLKGIEDFRQENFYKAFKHIHPAIITNVSDNNFVKSTTKKSTCLVM